MIELSDPTTEEERRNNRKIEDHTLTRTSKNLLVQSNTITHPIEERRQKVENKETVQIKERLIINFNNSLLCSEKLET